VGAGRWPLLLLPPRPNCPNLLAARAPWRRNPCRPMQRAHSGAALYSAPGRRTQSADTMMRRSQTCTSLPPTPSRRRGARCGHHCATSRPCASLVLRCPPGPASSSARHYGPFQLRWLAITRGGSLGLGARVAWICAWRLQAAGGWCRVLACGRVICDVPITTCSPQCLSSWKRFRVTRAPCLHRACSAATCPLRITANCRHARRQHLGHHRTRASAPRLTMPSRAARAGDLLLEPVGEPRCTDRHLALTTAILNPNEHIARHACAFICSNLV
jgi:hypothetical protein